MSNYSTHGSQKNNPFQRSGRRGSKFGDLGRKSIPAPVPYALSVPQNEYDNEMKQTESIDMRPPAQLGKQMSTEEIDDILDDIVFDTGIESKPSLDAIVSGKETTPPTADNEEKTVDDALDRVESLLDDVSQDYVLDEETQPRSNGAVIQQSSTDKPHLRAYQSIDSEMADNSLSDVVSATESVVAQHRREPMSAAALAAYQSRIERLHKNSGTINGVVLERENSNTDLSPAPRAPNPNSNDFKGGYRLTALSSRNNGEMLRLQNNKCATCADVLQLNMLRRPKYHYCRYTGELHCDPKCHILQKATIPQRVLKSLDTNEAKVCRKAKTYLDAMYLEPTIEMSMFDRQMFNNSRELKQLDLSVRQLLKINQYLADCPDRYGLKDTNEKIATNAHLLQFNGLLSLYDIVQVLKHDFLKEIVQFCEAIGKHVTNNCGHCQKKGQFCELCNRRTPIYSFQFREVKQCKSCHRLFHRRCLLSTICDHCKKP